MKRNETTVAFLKYIKDKNYITTSLSNHTENKQCIPLALSQTMLLVLRFQDFIPLGYEIIPLELIEQICHKESDVFFEQVLKSEGLGNWIDQCPEINLESWYTIFTYFEEQQELITVHTESEDYIDVGLVKQVDETEAILHCVNVIGKWDEDYWAEPYEEVLGIEFRNLYLKMFGKYSEVY